MAQPERRPTCGGTVWTNRAGFSRLADKRKRRTMNPSKTILAVAAILGLVATEAMAEQLIHLRGGRFVRGTVVSSTADSVTARYTPEGGEETTVTVSADVFDTYFFYGVRDKAISAAKDRIELAKYCVDNEMYSRAKIQMDHARAADPAVVEEFMQTRFPEIKEGLAERLLAAGQRALRRGSTKNAKWYASLILTKFEGTKAEAEAEKLLDQVQAVIDEKHAKERERHRELDERKAKRTAAKEERTEEKLFGPIDKLMAEGKKANSRGLKEKNTGTARDAFSSAANKYKQAAKRAEAGLKSEKDPEFTKALQEVHAQAIHGAVQAYLNAAHSLSSRGSYKQAVQFCNKALEVDPDNAEAKSARAEFSTASGWGRRGRR
jgi:tetratricopeptide (TPR) repeat protein